ncbi:MAG TPA: hypothetical protein PLM16_01235 [Candidatus Woesebacteria bacterium]|nr:hypothetical protein [Candidatus Woesebacteria bacterium]
MHQTNIVSVIGSPFENSWATAAQSGDSRIVAVLAIKSESAKNVGRELVALIEKHSDTSAKAIYNLCLDLLAQARKLEASMQMALVAFGNKPTSLGLPSAVLATNQGQILLKRDRKVGKVVFSANELKLVEGSIKENDEIILATSHTEQLEQSIRHLFKNNPSPDAFASNLRQKVNMLVDSSLFSLSLVKILDLDLKSLSPSPSLAVLEETTPEKMSPAQLSSTTIATPEITSPKTDPDRPAKIARLARHWGIQPPTDDLETIDKEEKAELDQKANSLEEPEPSIPDNSFAKNEFENLSYQAGQVKSSMEKTTEPTNQDESANSLFQTQTDETPVFFDEETANDIKIKINFETIFSTFGKQASLGQARLSSLLQQFKKKISFVLKQSQKWLSKTNAHPNIPQHQPDPALNSSSQLSSTTPIFTDNSNLLSIEKSELDSSSFDVDVSAIQTDEPTDQEVDELLVSFAQPENLASARLSENTADPAQENPAKNPSQAYSLASTRLKHFWQKTRSAIRFLLASRFKSNSTIYLDKEKKSLLNFKKIRVIVLITLVISLISFGISIVVKQQLRDADQAIQPGRDLLTQAREIESTNILMARNLLIQASELVKTNQAKQANNWLQQKRFSQFYQEIQEYSAQIDGQIEVSSLNQFFDLRTVQPEFLTSLISSNSTTLFLLDKERCQLAAIDKATKQTEVISLDSEPPVIDFSTTEDKLFFLQGGIKQIQLQPNTSQPSTDTSQEDAEAKSTPFLSLPTLIKSQGDSDRDGRFIESYDTYIYIFNPEKRNIFRYLLNRDGLSESVGWLTDKLGLDFDQITSMAIDGNIWLTAQDGSVLKYERGQKMNFEITRLNEPLGNSVRISTNPEAENLYLLEPDKNRLVILTKTGEFVKQVTSPTFASITQITIDEQLGKMYGITGSIVYELDL